MRCGRMCRNEADRVRAPVSPPPASPPVPCTVREVRGSGFRGRRRGPGFVPGGRFARCAGGISFASGGREERRPSRPVRRTARGSPLSVSRPAGISSSRGGPGTVIFPGRSRRGTGTPGSAATRSISTGAPPARSSSGWRSSRNLRRRSANGRGAPASRGGSCRPASPWRGPPCSPTCGRRHAFRDPGFASPLPPAVTARSSSTFPPGTTTSSSGSGRAEESRGRCARETCSATIAGNPVSVRSGEYRLLSMYHRSLKLRNVPPYSGRYVGAAVLEGRIVGTDGRPRSGVYAALVRQPLSPQPSRFPFRRHRRGRAIPAAPSPFRASITSGRGAVTAGHRAPATSTADTRGTPITP